MKKIPLILLVVITYLLPSNALACRISRPAYMIEQGIGKYKLVATESIDGGIGIIYGRDYDRECGIIEKSIGLSYTNLLIVAVLLLLLIFGVWYIMYRIKLSKIE